MKILIHRSLSFAAQCTKLNLRYHKGGIIKHTHSVLPQAQRPQTTTGELLRTSLKNEKVQNKSTRSFTSSSFEVAERKRYKMLWNHKTKPTARQILDYQIQKLLRSDCWAHLGKSYALRVSVPVGLFQNRFLRTADNIVILCQRGPGRRETLYTSRMSSQEGNGCVRASPAQVKYRKFRISQWKERVPISINLALMIYFST